MKTLKTVIVEDEELGIRNLQDKLSRNCPQVKVIGSFQTSQEAIREIPRLMPDLVLLDINIDSLNGFDILDRLKHLSFEVIFITSHNQYVIDAIRNNALDYIIKPVNEKELVEAVMRAWKKKSYAQTTNPKISIPTTHGFVFVSVDEIIHCQADDNRTIFHLFNKKTISASRSLKQFDELLKEFNFKRIHRTHLINSEYLEEFSRRDGGYVIKSNGDRLPVAKNRMNILG